MRRTWIVAGLIVTVAASAAVYQRGSHWKEYRYVGSRLKADLARPDALIRTSSLSKLPRDVLKVPIARDVLTQDLVFYYEQQEDQLGLSGAIRRIAYEHQLNWSDRILASALNAPAELAFWRDGKGALRHYALVMQRNALAKVLQQAATVALNDSQLKLAGEIDTGQGTAKVLALELNPRRTLLLISQGERLVLLSDPGLLFDGSNQQVPQARAAVVNWLTNEGVLARQFELDGSGAVAINAAPVGATSVGTASATAQTPPAASTGSAGAASAPGAAAARMASTNTATTPPAVHTLVVGAPTLALGYGAFMSGFKGLRFDFGSTWTTSVWVDAKALPASGLGDAELWRAAPANPSACVVLPIDWPAAQKVLQEADKQPRLPNKATLNTLSGSALACWYNESTLYAPVFITHLAKDLPARDAALQALANWAIAADDASAPGAASDDASHGKAKSANQGANKAAARADGKPTGKAKAKDDTLLWRASSGNASLAARGTFVAFSPDGALVDKVLDTLARSHPSVADQSPSSNATLAVLTPQPLSAMAEREMLRALGGAGDANLLAAAQTHLPARMKALAGYPAYRLELATTPAQSGWRALEWRTEGSIK